MTRRNRRQSDNADPIFAAEMAAAAEERQQTFRERNADFAAKWAERLTRPVVNRGWSMELASHQHSAKCRFARYVNGQFETYCGITRQALEEGGSDGTPASGPAEA